MYAMVVDAAPGADHCDVQDQDGTLCEEVVISERVVDEPSISDKSALYYLCGWSLKVLSEC